MLMSTGDSNMLIFINTYRREKYFKQCNYLQTHKMVYILHQLENTK